MCNLKKKKILKGLGASTGTAFGTSRIVVDVRTLNRIKNGDILVTSSITPHIISYLGLIRGIVTDKGGITSHAAIIAREVGLPCVVGTVNATKILQNGMTVLIDGFNGNVYWIRD